jgi:hypothetical protein
MDDELRNILTTLQIDVAIMKDHVVGGVGTEGMVKKVSRLEKHLYWTSGAGAVLIAVLGFFNIRITP